MPIDSSKNSGLCIFRSSPLADHTRPIIFLNWRTYDHSGDTIQEIRFYIAHPDRPLLIRSALLNARHGYAGTKPPINLETLLLWARDEIDNILEGQNLEAVRASHGSHGSPAPIELAEMTEDQFVIFALREDWQDVWKEVSSRRPGGKLGTILTDLRQSPILDYRFQNEMGQ